jgi:hypothetical protein
MPFHSRGVDRILIMDYDFLDSNLDDFPVENNSEDPQIQSDENTMAFEDNKFEVEMTKLDNPVIQNKSIEKVHYTQKWKLNDDES